MSVTQDDPSVQSNFFRSVLVRQCVDGASLILLTRFRLCVPATDQGVAFHQQVLLCGASHCQASHPGAGLGLWSSWQGVAVEGQLVLTDVVKFWGHHPGVPRAVVIVVLMDRAPKNHGFTMC